MSVALANVFDFSVVANILSYYSDRPDVEWDEVYGSCTIWRTKHIITYWGGGEGGFVYFYREREPGWYRWSRNWGSGPVYDKVMDGQVAIKWQEGVEHIGVLPHNWQDWDWDDGDDEVIVFTDEQMEEDT